MKSVSLFLSTAAWTLIAMSASAGSANAADGYGSLTGQFVLDGEIPQPRLVFAKNDPMVKDGEVCAAFDRFDGSLVVDEKTKGISDIFIYLRRAPDVHPDLAASKEKEVKFDQKGCTFTPHSLFVRTDQAVRVLSNDPISHNTHTFPIRNNGTNFILKPMDRVGVPVEFAVPEILPIHVKCDIHSWMLAHWLILDHPYAAITEKTGRFRIDKLPAGEHSFYVWHERVGYIAGPARRGIPEFKVMITAGETNDVEPYAIPLEKFFQ